MSLLLVLSSILAANCENCWGEEELSNMDLIDDTKPSHSFREQNVWVGNGFKVQHTSSKTIYGQMGLKDGDIIKQWNGRKLSRPDDLKFITDTINENKGLTAVVYRGGKEKIFRFPIDSSK